MEIIKRSKVEFLNNDCFLNWVNTLSSEQVWIQLLIVEKGTLQQVSKAWVSHWQRPAGWCILKWDRPQTKVRGQTPGARAEVGGCRRGGAAPPTGRPAPGPLGGGPGRAGWGKPSAWLRGPGTPFATGCGGKHSGSRGQWSFPLPFIDFEGSDGLPSRTAWGKLEVGSARGSRSQLLQLPRRGWAPGSAARPLRGSGTSSEPAPLRPRAPLSRRSR